MSATQRLHGIIIDDDPEFVESIRHYLAKLGIDLKTTHTVEDFARALQGAPPDFCIIDMNLGGVVAGFALIQSIRSRLKWSIPLFVMSHDSDPGAVARAIELGATDYIFKPINRQILTAKFSGLLASPELSETEVPFVEVSTEESLLEIGMDLELVAVDELGVTLRSRSLLSKGTLLKLNAEVLSQITGRPGVHLVTVADTSMGQDRAYLAYCEFENQREGELAAVRKWIGAKRITGQKA